MADPISLGLGVSLIGGATGAIGSIFGGQANAAMYNYQAAVAQMNAGIAKQNAAYEVATGESQQVEKGMAVRAEISQTRATQGASGLDLNTGSAASVRESEQQLGQFDQNMIRYNAERKAYGDQITALGYETSASLDKMAASTSQTTGMLNAATSILGSAGSFSSKWLQGQQQGMFGGTSGGVSGLMSGAIGGLMS